MSATSKRASQRVKDVDPARLAMLNAGEIEAATLTECLAIDFAALMRVVLPEVGDDAATIMECEAKTGISKRMALAARLSYDRLGAAAIDNLRKHRSDTLRGWACFMIGATNGVTLTDRLAAIRPLADDHHFAVREWSWMAMRSHLAVDLDEAIANLAGWTADPSERLRRFASEAIRPRGVWCVHIVALKRQPAKALPILESLRADPAAYVQDSVGNWLNDAAKDQPEWVRGLCARWTAESPNPATYRICKRALRSINSKD